MRPHLRRRVGGGALQFDVAGADSSDMGSVPPELIQTEILTIPDLGDVAVGVGVGGQYLVMEMSGRAGPCWVCAPVTDRALDCVRSGKATPWTVLHHSATGTVDIYRTLLDGSVHESVVLCAALPVGRSVLAAA
jgi:hypothetical protein